MKQLNIDQVLIAYPRYQIHGHCQVIVNKSRLFVFVTARARFALLSVFSHIRRRSFDEHQDKDRRRLFIIFLLFNRKVKTASVKTKKSSQLNYIHLISKSFCEFAEVEIPLLAINSALQLQCLPLNDDSFRTFVTGRSYR